MTHTKNHFEQYKTWTTTRFIMNVYYLYVSFFILIFIYKESSMSIKTIHVRLAWWYLVHNLNSCYLTAILKTNLLRLTCREIQLWFVTVEFLYLVTKYQCCTKRDEKTFWTVEFKLTSNKRTAHLCTEAYPGLQLIRSFALCRLIFLFVISYNI